MDRVGDWKQMAKVMGSLCEKSVHVEVSYLKICCPFSNNGSLDLFHTDYLIFFKLKALTFLISNVH